jgi:hypothetical protein
MTQITRDEIETTLTEIYDRLTAAKKQIREETAEKLIGRQITIRRDLKNPATGLREETEVVATVTGLRWSYEDDMDMKVQYTHPFTGKLMEAEEGM